MKVGAKVAGECNFAPTFVRYSRFSSRASTGIFRKVRFYRPRIRLRIIVFCVGCWSGFAPFSLSFSLSLSLDIFASSYSTRV